VDQVGILLGVSKFTVYNYLQKIRAAQAIENTRLPSGRMAFPSDAESGE